MKINASITITRDSNDTIRVQVQDKASRANFVMMEFSPHDFMLALTGLASVDAQTTEVVGLDVVGKRKVLAQRSILYPGSHATREQLRAWLIENGQEEGWILNPYLGSQGSVRSNGETTILNYGVYRYEEITAQESVNG